MAGTRNILQQIGAILIDFAEWIAETFHDPVIAREIQADIGLSTDRIAAVPVVDAALKTKIEAFFRKEDVDTAAFVETAVEINALIDTIWTFVEAAKADGTDAWDVFWLLFKVWAADWLRVRNPSAHALVTLAGLIVEDDEVLPTLDFSIVNRLLTGQKDPAGLHVLPTQVVAGLLAWLELRTREELIPGVPEPPAGVDAVIDTSFGWDPEPGTPIEAALAAMNALTVRFEAGDLDPVLTVIPVEESNGGPGFVVSVGSALKLDHDTGTYVYTFEMGLDGAFTLFFRLSDDDPGFRVMTDSAPPSFVVEVERKPPTKDGKPRPFLIIGSSDGFRIEIGKLAYGVVMTGNSAGFRLRLIDSKVVIPLGSGDGFLKHLPGESIEAPLKLSLLADTTHGLRFDGGSGLRVDLPVAASVFGVFTVQALSLELKLEGDSPALEVRGAFSLKLGAFMASVDQLGIGIGSGEKDKDVGSLVRFLPPRGIGLVLDWGVVKGGGYLSIDPNRGEYFGALELKFAAWSIKALALITTKRPDGSEGWSLLVVVYGQFHIHVGFGIFWNGIGGMIGIHHRADLDALQAGVRSGALDDILFPANPVADAPRIIARYRQIFPVEQDTLLFGVMVEFAFSQPPVVYARLGLIFEVRNALGGGPSELSKVILLGQLLVQLPPRDLSVPAIVKLLVDITGAWDADTQRLWIRGSLRDSFVGIEGFAKISLSGDLFVMQQFGDHPTFLLTAGGFHPDFTDLPDGTPTDLKRMATSFGIGPIKLRTETYFAITSNSLQAGYAIELKADIDVASIEGRFQVDVLLYLEPRFHFLARASFQVVLKAFSRRLASVTVRLTLEGPGQWRAAGYFSFSILWWDVEIDFDERWGSSPEITATTTSAVTAVRKELGDPSRVQPGPPVGGSALVTLAPADPTRVLAHPLAQLTVAQKAVPFDVEIDRIGTQPLSEGRIRFTIDSVRIGDQDASSKELVSDHFARGQYMELSDAERVGSRSFETFTSGVRIGATDYSVGAAGITVAVEYEVEVLEPAPTLNMVWSVAAVYVEALTPALAVQLVHFGAAALSPQANARGLHAEVGKAALADLALAVVDPVTLIPLGRTVTSPSIAGQRAAASGGIVVAAFEASA